MSVEAENLVLVYLRRLDAGMDKLSLEFQELKARFSLSSLVSPACVAKSRCWARRKPISAWW
jgi:hypothetical protein